MASHVVLGVFPDEAAADTAAADLKAWDKVDDDVKLNAIGVLVLDEKGKIKVGKVGSRSVSKGAGIGILLALLTPVTLVGGIIGGAILGAFHHKGLGLSAEERDAIGAQLTDGKAAVGVLATDENAQAIATKLAELGGTVQSHELSDEALAAAAEVAAAPAEEAPAAADEPPVAPADAPAADPSATAS
jgi:uncharacterized membrane protein